MGACDFYQSGIGQSIADAFAGARDHAAYEHGHGGYTGTLAEKEDWAIIDGSAKGSLPPEPHAYGVNPTATQKEHWAWEAEARKLDDPFIRTAMDLVENDDPRVSDKWGPAGAIRLPDHADGRQRWLFFGYASS